MSHWWTKYPYLPSAKNIPTKARYIIFRFPSISMTDHSHAAPKSKILTYKRWNHDIYESKSSALISLPTLSIQQRIYGEGLQSLDLGFLITNHVPYTLMM